MKNLHLLLAATATAVAFSLPAADLNVPTTAYPTIQAAVNAAQTNDTIHIAAGVYTGQVVISNKVLTLIGQPGTILRATTNMPPFPAYLGLSIPSIMGIRSSQVTVRGLTFEGERLAERFVDPGVGDLEGIFSRQSSCTVENCAFYGFRESTPGPKGGDAIVFVNFEDGPTEVNLRVVGSTFADNYAGVVVVGLPTRKSINVTLENNTIIGPGPLTGDNNFAGVLIQQGVSGRIAGNTISGYSYVGTTADFPISYGILAVNQANYPAFGILQPLTIEGNILRDNQIHITLIKGDGSVVRNNRCQGTAPGILPLGLAVSGTNMTIANNQFEDLPEGIRLLGDDPDFGTSLGITISAQVTSNRFCNVTTPINLEPLATATQVGTLLGSCSSNALTIAPAVLVSWPVEEDGWTIESATSLGGPWAASGATSFIQYGRRSIAVPTDGTNRFFRTR